MFQKSRLLRPLLFIEIKSDGLNWYRIYIPLILCSMLFIYIYFFPLKIGMLLIKNTAEYLVVMPGFYIAALSAVATFHRSSLDRQMRCPEARLESSENGNIKIRNMTRRRFLCYLFGYLSFVSIILYFLFAVFINANPILLIPCQYQNIAVIIDYCLQFLSLFFLVQIVVLTCLSIFYLCDRVHWNDIE